ncbi:MAG TPA: ATP-grasp domain-containing protein [Pseudonocardia sp.]|uniref:carboxylate--amine ligase n=1 Tax=Pseudonocardia sp. TaxID=60912 RepID=UPI002B4AB082|nr:ATP-grasp domain-containing protein [Pseudonocardia sp.]HLU59671.1 ATP-grasp domain-containing protein [Pseudonocardia sp.]
MSGKPLALVLGARVIEVVRALAMDGVPVGVVAPTGDPARWSRCARTVLTWDWMLSAERHDAALADRLVRFAHRQATPPVLLWCSDQSMLFVSRHRDRLAEGFRFVLPDACLVEAMEDKARFAALAAAHALPVPPTVVVDGRSPEPPDELRALGLPVIVKPTARDRSWVAAVGGSAKAVRIGTEDELRRFWPRLRELSKPAIAQQSVPGPETAVVSYHVYVDEHGGIAGEFTGRKIRTIPAEYGHTSALSITDDDEVARLGRHVCRVLGLRGVAKIDFKYGPDGRLHLFEINARLTLWAHPGARAGVNLPALVHADLTGRPRPTGANVRRRVDWVHPKDVLAARAHGIPVARWVSWLARAHPVTGVWKWDDPGPLLGMAAVRARDAVLRRTSGSEE